MYKRKSVSSIVALVLVTICLLTFVVSAGAIALERVTQALALIKVPGDYPTIQAAIDAAEPGDVIQVSPGTYNENLILSKAVSLTARDFDQINPVNNQTIIDGGSGSATILIPAGLTQMPAIRGFVIRGGLTGIQASSPFVAEFNYLHSSVILANYELGAGGINRYNVYFKAGNDAIHLDDTNRPLLIEHNRILYAEEDGIEINLQGDTAPPSVIEVDIWNNMIIGSGQDGIQYVDFDSVPEENSDNKSEPADTNRRFVIVGNLIANSGKAGIGLMPGANPNEDFSGANTQEAIRVYNNTFYGNNLGISGGSNLVAFNNIIANSIIRGVWRVQGAPGTNSVIAYTLFFGNQSDASESNLGAGIISGQDPLFVAAPNPGPDGTWETVDDDFSGLLLQAGSPAIDKGVTQYVAVSGEAIPPQPITGFTGAAPDLGWREFGSPAFITPTPTPFVLFPTAVPTFTFPPPTATGLVTVPPSSETPTPPQAVTPTPGSQTPEPTSTFTPVPNVTATNTVTITPTPGVIILKIEPVSAQIGTTINMLIFGSGFEAGATVTFEGALGIAPQATTVEVVNPNLIMVTVNVQADAGIGAQVWDVRVLNLDSSTTVLLDAFTVLPAE